MCPRCNIYIKLCDTKETLKSSSTSFVYMQLTQSSAPNPQSVVRFPQRLSSDVSGNVGTKTKVRLSIIAPDPYPTFQKIRGSSAALPSGWRRGEMTCSKDGRYAEERKKKSGKREAWRSLRALRCTREPAHTHPSILFSLYFSDGHLCRLPARLFSHNLLCGLQLPPLTACLDLLTACQSMPTHMHIQKWRG